MNLANPITIMGYHIRCMHNGIVHCATVPLGAVSVLLMHLLRQGTRLRNEAHVTERKKAGEVEVVTSKN